MKRVSLLILVSVLGLSACNTMQGLGKDVEKAGEALQRSAK